MKFFENQSLKAFNTFGLDVKTRWFTEVSNAAELQEVLRNDRFKNVKKMVLGGGSNVLFGEDFDGLMIHNNFRGIEILSEDEKQVTIKSGAGEVWHEFVLFTIAHNFPGLENLSLIPGFVGAAPIQNIGAYGVEIKKTFKELTAIDLIDESMRVFTNADCRFGYRDSVFKREAKNRYIIVDVTFCLDKNASLNTSYGAINEQLKNMNVTDPTIRDVSDAVIFIRRSKLPDPKDIGNAGSFFKNPEIPSTQFEKLKSKHSDIIGFPTHDNHIKVAAGWLIEHAGWKGKRVGNVGMHAKQALVLVNYGNATGHELVEHAKRVKESVKEKFGVEIEMEVNIVDD
jgi:UDP-N-acetylmuramate dehydrogenase